GQVYGYERPQYFGSDGEPSLTFSRPAWFENVRHEVEQAHEKAAIFDASTFGKIDVIGSDASSFLNRICTNQMDRKPGRAMYTCMLNERGGIESDLTAVRMSEDAYRLYVGTASLKRDWSWLNRSVRDGESVQLVDRTNDFCIIGLMGPDSARIAVDLGASALNELGYFASAEIEITGKRVRATRLSYVGEAGWELTCRADDAVAIYDALYERGACPAGTLAQTSMRIEKGYLSYGHDLDTDLNPLEAGLGFAVAWGSGFVGEESLLELRDKPLNARVVTLRLDDSGAVPLGNEPVLFDNTIVGKTTSAAYGYRVDRPVAIALLSGDGASLPDGTRIEVDIARQRFAGTVSFKAVFDPAGKVLRGAA
ncbi:MAG: aminomethyltransferase family protein, partial [Gammaproteobacteria bacterium]